MKFESPEEEHVGWWIEALFEAGLVRHWGRSKSYPLAPAVSREWIERRFSPKTGKPLKSRHRTVKVFSEWSYEPDFEIQWAPAAHGIFYVENALTYEGPDGHRMIAHNGVSTVEVKPALARVNRMNHSRLLAARLAATALFQAHGVVTNLVQVSTRPKSFFDRTFTPDRFLWTNKSGMPRKIHFQPKSLDEFLESAEKLKTIE